MTRRERLIRSVQHKETDFCPHNIDLTWQAKDNLTKYTNDPDYIENHANNHIASTSIDVQEEIRLGYFKDLFGVVWDKTGADKDIGVITGLVLKEPKISDIKLPFVSEEHIRGRLDKLMAEKNDKAKFFNVNFSLFERAWTVRGMENLLCDMLGEEDFTDALFDSICDFNCRLINIALEYDIDGIYFGDDWGQQKGLITGPKLWKRFIKPRLARQYGLVKAKNKIVIQHSCGDIYELFGDLIDIGLDVYNTFQPEIYDFNKFKSEYGKDLTIFGALSTQRDLPYMSPEEVKTLVKDTIKVLGAGGGYIAAPTHAVAFDVPPENIVALIDAFNNQ